MSEESQERVNVLAIDFGEGRVEVSAMTDPSHVGLHLRYSEQPHEVGALLSENVPYETWLPSELQEGDVLLRFKNAKSCRVVMAVMRRVIQLLEKREGASVPTRPQIVCLCGSARFLDAFNQAEFTETLAGKIVLTIGCNTHDVARSENLQQHKPQLDELHLRKIDLADEVFILNVGGYIGESTGRELAYARQQGKVVRFLEPVDAL